MAITLELSPEIEESLATKARSRGISLELYLSSLLADFATTASDVSEGERKAAAFEEWVSHFHTTIPLPDGATSRDLIYRRDDGSPR